jgi:hypothetical protein
MKKKAEVPEKRICQPTCAKEGFIRNRVPAVKFKRSIKIQRSYLPYTNRTKEDLMPLKRFVRRLFLYPAFVAGLLLIAACAATPPPNVTVNADDCGVKNIDWQVVPEAQIVAFSCARGRHEGEDSLIFTVGLKNAAEKPQRFRFNIFLLDMDKGVSYLVPTTGKPPCWRPGPRTP